MRKKHILFVVAMLCLYFPAGAQKISPLSVGDRLPEEFWKSTHEVFANGRISRESLEKYAGRPLIFDFWACWCTSCLKKFPLLDSVSRETGLAIVLINAKNTGDRPEKIARTLSPLSGGTFSLPSIVSDSLLVQYFPNHILPHYVWIDATGRVQAITGTVPLNRQSLLEMSKEKKRKRKPVKK